MDADKLEGTLGWKVIRFLNSRGGFDHWWDDIAEEDQQEIIESVNELLAGEGVYAP